MTKYFCANLCVIKINEKKNQRVQSPMRPWTKETPFNNPINMKRALLLSL